MNVAISGDRSSCLAQEVAPGAHIVAFARGFGHIDRSAIAPLVLARLRTEVQRRVRGGRLARAQRRPKGVVTLLSSAFGRVNGEMHARSAANDDYVTAGCSLTGALLVGNCAYLAHAGSTAAYLSRDGYVVSLTKNDALQTPAGTVLTRAIGSAPTLQVAVSCFTLNEGDALILAARRFTPEEERAGQWEREQSLVVRYANEPPAFAAVAASPLASRILRGTIATLVFYALLCLK